MPIKNSHQTKSICCAAQWNFTTYEKIRLFTVYWQINKIRTKTNRQSIEQFSLSLCKQLKGMITKTIYKEKKSNYNSSISISTANVEQSLGLCAPNFCFVHNKRRHQPQQQFMIYSKWNCYFLFYFEFSVSFIHSFHSLIVLCVWFHRAQ